jgi:hypothetical protein
VEVVEAYFKVLCCLSVGTEENHESPRIAGL